MEKQITHNLFPKNTVIFGGGLGILIPAIFVFGYFLVMDGLVAAVDGGMFMIFFTGPFTGPLGIVIGAILVTSRRFSGEERRKANYVLMQSLGVVIGLILGFWIPAVSLFIIIAGDNGEFMLPGIIYAFCGGVIFALPAAAGGKFLAKYLLKN